MTVLMDEWKSFAQHSVHSNVSLLPHASPYKNTWTFFFIISEKYYVDYMTSWSVFTVWYFQGCRDTLVTIIKSNNVKS
jgi:hypothetical protein